MSSEFHHVTQEAISLKAIQLPSPTITNSMSVSAALELRKTIREFSIREFPQQLMSNLLWAAFGVNRKSGPFGAPGRTAASASNSQEIDLYVALKQGVFLYDANNNLLAPVINGDLRSLALTLSLIAMVSVAHADTKCLAMEKQCFFCHTLSMDKRIAIQVNKAPDFKSIAERYKGQAN